MQIPSLALRAFMQPALVREGLAVPREPALLTSAGRMPERSQHRVSGGRMPERTSGDGARAAPNRGQPVRGWLYHESRRC